MRTKDFQDIQFDVQNAKQMVDNTVSPLCSPLGGPIR